MLMLFDSDSRSGVGKRKSRRTDLPRMLWNTSGTGCSVFQDPISRHGRSQHRAVDGMRPFYCR